MFIIMGISPKIKPQGIIANCPCPVCGQNRALQVMHKYMTPHIFFIPTFRFHSEYIAVCESCASVMELPKETGRALQKDPAYPVYSQDLYVLQNNMRQVCPDCGEAVAPGQNFCPNCGNRVYQRVTEN